MTARYIEHVTLTTGHSRRSPRGEVSAAAPAAMRELIDRMQAAPESAVPAPGCPGYSIGGRGDGRCLVATVWADGPPSEVWIGDFERCLAWAWLDLLEEHRR